MGYAGKSEKVFSSRFCRRETAIETVSPRFGIRKERIAHGASLTLFLIFCKIIAAWRKFADRTILFLAFIPLAVDLQLVQVLLKYANLSVMAGLDPAIHAASAPFASHFRFM
jgi:hypothetical protein